jgi:hypothetical protein
MTDDFELNRLGAVDGLIPVTCPRSKPRMLEVHTIIFRSLTFLRIQLAVSMLWASAWSGL